MSVEGRGVGIERPDGLLKDDDEFDAYRKRMMLAYRFRPNPLVSICLILSAPLFHKCSRNMSQKSGIYCQINKD